MANAPTASHSLTVRLTIQNVPGMLGRITSAIGKAGGDIGAIDIVSVDKKTLTRDLTFNARDERHGQQVIERLRAVDGVDVVNVSDRTFLMHLGGKIEVKAKVSVKTRDDLSMAPMSPPALPMADVIRPSIPGTFWMVSRTVRL